MKALSKLSRSSVALALLVTSVAAPSVAFADDPAPKGTIALLEVNTTSADTYLQYHGRAVVTSGGKGAASSVEYRWGGTSCGTRTLPESMVAMLQHALDTATPITPRTQQGQGQALCLVGFALTP